MPMPTDVPEQLLGSIADAARILSLSRSNTYKLAKRGEIPVVRIGGLLRVVLPKRREQFLGRTSGGSNHTAA